MSMLQPTYIWQLTPEEMANFDKATYRKREPDRIEQPKSLLQTTRIGPYGNEQPKLDYEGQKFAKERKFKISEQEYLKLRLQGYPREQIALKSGIKMDTMRGYLRTWGIGSKKAEQEAMNKLRTQ